MGLIARTNGANSGTPLEIRSGVLGDIAEADRSNWVDCNVISPNITSPEKTTISHRVAEIQPDGGVTVTYSTVDVPSYFLIETLLNTAAEHRWRNMQKGVVINGMKVDTSDSSIAKINGAIYALEQATFSTIRWKTNGGEWIELNLAAMRGIHAAVSTFIQSNYDTEKAIVDAIKAGTITTIAEIKNYAWP